MKDCAAISSVACPAGCVERFSDLRHLIAFKRAMLSGHPGKGLRRSTAHDWKE